MEIAGVIRSEDAAVLGRIGAVREAAEFFFDYDNLGHPAWEQYGTGAPAAKVSFSWSNEGDLLTLGHALQGTAGVSYTDAYTPAHQIASAALDNAAYRYVPPANGTDSYVPNALNQYASVTPAGAAAVSIGYDLKGNLTSDGTFAFAYDAENKLVTAAKTGTAAAYAYDGLGRRDEKTVNGTSTYFLSADADEIAEYDGAGTLLRRYVPGPAIDRPIAMVDAAGTKTFFHQDKTGSVIAMSDAAGNRTEGPYLYDAFGNGAPYTGVPFKYTGRRLDPETGLYYYRARYYCAPCGRFMQTDSIGYADDINWYTYVGNDPTDKTDPSGLTCQVSRIDTAPGSVCGGSNNDPSYSGSQAAPNQQQQNSPQPVRVAQMQNNATNQTGRGDGTSIGSAPPEQTRPFGTLVGNAPIGDPITFTARPGQQFTIVATSAGFALMPSGGRGSPGGFTQPAAHFEINMLPLLSGGRPQPFASGSIAIHGPITGAPTRVIWNTVGVGPTYTFRPAQFQLTTSRTIDTPNLNVMIELYAEAAGLKP